MNRSVFEVTAWRVAVTAAGAAVLLLAGASAASAAVPEESAAVEQATAGKTPGKRPAHIDLISAAKNWTGVDIPTQVAMGLVPCHLVDSPRFHQIVAHFSQSDADAIARACPPGGE
ncbi:hypothetical protein [Glycomyces paridis]|uniref:DUF732 domain-containing protein n=1 Tax=Glycomyces paridis TaxID=2126555 RepID=A0A4S8P8T9_9ACTN|nr:hypothetical protein [Glycomyces paridis]THV24404.1 hypothetical protein E9998_21520 [Glycomyces paridis]